MQFVPLVGDQTAAFTGGRTGFRTNGNIHSRENLSQTGIK